MGVRASAMSRVEFRAALKLLGKSPYAIASELGVSIRQAHRYQSGETVIPGPVARVLQGLVKAHRLNKEKPRQ